MKKRNLYLSISCLFLSLCGQAQTLPKVHIDLPHFANKPYVFYLMQGDSRDTILRGALDENGKTLLTLPERQKGFAGISKFMVVNEGGLDIILNGEAEFTVRCTEAAPNINNIYYIGSEENKFLFEQYQKEGKILEKVSAVEGTWQQYASPGETLYLPLKTERNRLHKQYARLQEKTAHSPLYSARIREMSDFLQGLGSHLNLQEKEIQRELREFVLSRIDFRQLYNSGLWNDILGSWIELETGFGDSVLLADSRILFARCADKELRRELLNKLIVLYNRYGKEELLSQLNVEDLLSPGHYAPKLRLENAHITPVESMVIFYESGCNSCENELIQLRANYRILQERGLRVISVAADSNEEIYRKNTGLFPWTDKYCDYKGFAGENFVNYQVVGTPVIFVVDKDGIIIGRYARLAEYLNNPQNTG